MTNTYIGWWVHGDSTDSFIVSSKGGSQYRFQQRSSFFMQRKQTTRTQYGKIKLQDHRTKHGAQTCPQNVFELTEKTKNTAEGYVNGVRLSTSRWMARHHKRTPLRTKDAHTFCVKVQHQDEYIHMWSTCLFVCLRFYYIAQ